MEGGLGSSILQLAKINRRLMAQPSPANYVLALHGETGLGSPENMLGTLGSLLLEKLRELLHWLESIPGFVQKEIDRILPPETRSATLHHWLVVGLTVVLPIALSLLCLYYCCKCCCCSGGGRGAAVKMMKAPGRKGLVMPRPTFEGDPKGYFRDLRAKRELLC